MAIASLFKSSHRMLRSVFCRVAQFVDIILDRRRSRRHCRHFVLLSLYRCTVVSLLKKSGFLYTDAPSSNHESNQKKVGISLYRRTVSNHHESNHKKVGISLYRLTVSPSSNHESNQKKVGISLPSHRLPAKLTLHNFTVRRCGLFLNNRIPSW